MRGFVIFTLFAATATAQGKGKDGPRRVPPVWFPYSTSSDTSVLTK